MQTYVALLRGVNAAGRNIVKMAELRQAVESLGLQSVKTYLQSGNLAMRAEGPPAMLAQRLEKMMGQVFGVDAAVFVRSLEEMRLLINENPFLDGQGVPPAGLHVVFLKAPAPKAGLEKLAAIPAGEDRHISRGREIYLHCPNGYGRTRLSNSAIEKALKSQATTRNWNTVTRLFALAESII